MLKFWPNAETGQECIISESRKMAAVGIFGVKYDKKRQRSSRFGITSEIRITSRTACHFPRIVSRSSLRRLHPISLKSLHIHFESFPVGPTSKTDKRVIKHPSILKHAPSGSLSRWIWVFPQGWTINSCRVSEPCGTLGALMMVLFGVWAVNPESQPPDNVKDFDSLRASVSLY